MSILGTFQKQPNDILDYDVSFAEWLGSDQIFSHTAVVSPAGGLTIAQSAVMTGATAIKVVCSGGTTGTKYKVTVRIVTNSIPSLAKEAEFYVTVREI